MELLSQVSLRKCCQAQLRRAYQKGLISDEGLCKLLLEDNPDDCECTGMIKKNDNKDYSFPIQEGKDFSYDYGREVPRMEQFNETQTKKPKPIKKAPIQGGNDLSYGYGRENPKMKQFNETQVKKTKATKANGEKPKYEKTCFYEREQTPTFDRECHIRYFNNDPEDYNEYSYDPNSTAKHYHEDEDYNDHTCELKKSSPNNTCYTLNKPLNKKSNLRNKANGGWRSDEGLNEYRITTTPTFTKMNPRPIASSTPSEKRQEIPCPCSEMISPNSDSKANETSGYSFGLGRTCPCGRIKFNQFGEISQSDLQRCKACRKL